MKENTILILGAKSDIAKATARKFAAEGYNIILAAKQAILLKDFANDLVIRHVVNVNIVEFDVMDIKHHSRFIESLDGVPSVVLSAIGYLGSNNKGNYPEVKKTLDINYAAQINILNEFASLYKASTDGAIISISSVAGDRGRKSNYFYGAAKAAMTTYLSGLRNELFEYGVHVMTVKPGFVDTSMTKDMKLPQALTAHPDEVAEDIYKGFVDKKDVIYTKWFWKYIMLIIKLIPETLFKRLSI